MNWTREHESYITALPPEWGGGQARASRVAGGWRVTLATEALDLRNPRLRSWMAARTAVEACVRAHFMGPAASARAPKDLRTPSGGRGSSG